MSMSDTARKIPGVAAAQGAITGALATEDDLPLANYDDQSAEDVAARLKGFTQRELRTIDAYERKRRNRATIIGRVAKLPATSRGPATTSRASTPLRRGSTISPRNRAPGQSATSAGTRTAPE